MSIVVEDGTGLSNAETYVSVANASTYHANFGNAAWAAATTAAQESALRMAAQYIDSHYTFLGDPITLQPVNITTTAEGTQITDVPTQALAWPRTVAPWPVTRVVNACCEMALRALTGVLFADQSNGDMIRSGVGPISVEYRPTGLAGQVRYAVVDALLAPYTGGSRFAMRLERAS